MVFNWHSNAYETRSRGNPNSSITVREISSSIRDTNSLSSNPYNTCERFDGMSGAVQPIEYMQFRSQSELSKLFLIFS